MPHQDPSADGPEEGHADNAFDLTGLLGYRLVRLSAAIGQLADHDAGEVAGLTLPEYRVLVVLLVKGPLGVAGLQQAMLIDKAWISRTLAKLVEKGLAVSTPDHQDGRRNTIMLTAKGRRSATALMERARQRQARILRGFDDDEIADLLGLLSRVQRNVDDLGAGS